MVPATQAALFLLTSSSARPEISSPRWILIIAADVGGIRRPALGQDVVLDGVKLAAQLCYLLVRKVCGSRRTDRRAAGLGERPGPLLRGGGCLTPDAASLASEVSGLLVTIVIR